MEVNELTPSQVREEAEKLARKEVASQMAQFKEFGIMADWSPESTYRTLGEHGWLDFDGSHLNSLSHRPGIRIAAT